MKKTLLIPLLGAAGLLAVWYFILRKSPAAPTEPTLANTLAAATAAGATTTTPPTGAVSALAGNTAAPSADSGGGLLAGLVAALTRTPAPAAAAPPKAWAWTGNAAGGYLWTHRTTGQQQTLAVGQNPNKPLSLTPASYAVLATPANDGGFTVSNPAGASPVVVTGSHAAPLAPTAAPATGTRIGAR